MRDHTACRPAPRTGRVRRALAALVPVLACLVGPPALAHKASDAYLQYTVQGDRVEERIDIALRDLDRDLGLDADGDARLSWGEVRGRWADLQGLVERSVQLRADGRACTREPDTTAPALDDHSDGAHAVLRRQWRCDAAVRRIEVDYRLFATTDAQHRGIVRVDRADAAPGPGGTGSPSDTADGAPQGKPAVLAAHEPGPAVTGRDPAATQAAVLGPQRPVARFDLGDPSAPSAGAGSAEGGTPTHFAGFLAEGVHHILIGTDHILFLLALLLPAVLCLPQAGGDRGSGAPVAGRSPAAAGWQAAASLRESTLEVVRIVTAFTVAHSITLSLAVLDVVDPPSRWVESIIAASVVLAALNNLHPLVRRTRWGLTFAFGLVHGFGFAGALKELGLGGGALLPPLLGFNLGVELGQLALVALFLPLAWLLRHTRLYQVGLLRGGSAAIALLAAAWFTERAFDWTPPGLAMLLP